jgi:hypothetical protein
MPEDIALQSLIAQHTTRPRKHTETNLVARLITAASKCGARLWRNNVGTLRDARGSYVTYGLCVGSSDLIGYRVVVVTPEMVGQKVAVFTAIEAKSATGRATDRQQRFIEQVNFDGGIGQVVRSERELEMTLKRR